MAKKDQDFEIHQGDDKRLIVDVLDEDDITGATINWHLAQQPNKEALIEKSTDDDITIAEDIFYIFLKPEDTLELNPDILYYHEAELIDDSGNTYTILTGRVSILPALIKP